MNWTSFCACAAVGAAMCATPARAETDADRAAPAALAHPGYAAPARQVPAVKVQAAPASKAQAGPGVAAPGAAAQGRPPGGGSAGRPPFFAPDAARLATRLPAEQREERGFIRDTAATSRFEAEASKLALAKSTNPGIRAFAAELVNHHNGTSVELTYLLHVRGMAQPMLDNDHRKVLKQLGKLSGRKFDREYIKLVGLEYQREDIRELEKASLTTRDPSLKGWVDRQLPTRRYHLMTAERLVPAEPKPAQAAKPTTVMGAARPSPGPAPAIAVRPGAAPVVVAPKPAAAPRPAVSRAVPATQAMGTGPAPASRSERRATQPVAAKPSESSNR